MLEEATRKRRTTLLLGTGLGGGTSHPPAQMGVQAYPRGRKAQFPAAQGTAMARPAVLWLLPLLLLLYSASTDPSVISPIQMSQPYEPIQFRVSQWRSPLPVEQVQLRCEVLGSKSITGCSWLFQAPDPGMSPEFLVYMGTFTSFQRPGLNGISGRREPGNVFVLTLDNFEESQQGYYFCVVISNSIMHFSSRLPLFLPPRPTTMLANVPAPGKHRSESPDLPRESSSWNLTTDPNLSRSLQDQPQKAPLP